MKKFMAAVTFLVGLSLAGTPAQDKKDQTKAIRDAAFAGVNALRAKEKLPPLKRNQQLDAIAQKHAENMARQDKYGDDNKNGHILDGKNPIDRIKEGGYQALAANENVHKNFKEADPAKEAVRGWNNSPRHRGEIMNKLYQETGMGAAQSKSGIWYFCQLFGVPKVGEDFQCSFENRTETKLGLFIQLAKITLPSSPGIKGPLKLNIPAKELAVVVTPPEGMGKPVPVTARHGKSYVITGDPKKGFKVEEEK